MWNSRPSLTMGYECHPQLEQLCNLINTQSVLTNQVLWGEIIIAVIFVYFIIVIICGVRVDQMQGLINAMQNVYHWTEPPGPTSLF